MTPFRIDDIRKLLHSKILVKEKTMNQTRPKYTELLIKNFVIDNELIKIKNIDNEHSSWIGLEQMNDEYEFISILLDYNAG